MEIKFIKLEPKHMKGCQSEKVIPVSNILEITKTSDGQFCLDRTMGKNISLTKEGYNYLFRTLNPTQDYPDDIIGDGIGEKWL